MVRSPGKVACQITIQTTSYTSKNACVCIHLFERLGYTGDSRQTFLNPVPNPKRWHNTFFLHQRKKPRSASVLINLVISSSWVAALLCSIHLSTHLHSQWQRGKGTCHYTPLCCCIPAGNSKHEDFASLQESRSSELAASGEPLSQRAVMSLKRQWLLGSVELYVFATWVLT